MLADSIKLFITVIEQKNFSRAAELLYISQPSVSLHIRNLENEFGAKLINRTSKYVEPTQAGEILYEHAKQILSMYENAKQEINLLKNVVTGSLKIGASFTIGEYILPFVLAEFAVQYPNVTIDVTIANTEEVSQKVYSNNLDVGLVEGTIDPQHFNHQIFAQDEMLLIVPNNHPLARKSVVTANDLQDQVWILRESGSGTRAFSDNLIHEWGLRVKRSFVFSSSQGVKQAVISGLGIALLSKLIPRKELDAKELTSIPIEGKLLIRSLRIIRSKEPISSKAIDVFLDKILSVEINL